MQHTMMTYRVYIINRKRKRATSPLERHTTESRITRDTVIYYIPCHLRSLIIILGRFLPIYGQFPVCWLVETQNPWLWLVCSCQGRHDEQRQFWRKSLFLEACTLTGDSLESYGFYRRTAKMAAIRNTPILQFPKSKTHYRHIYMKILQLMPNVWR